MNKWWLSDYSIQTWNISLEAFDSEKGIIQREETSYQISSIHLDS